MTELKDRHTEEQGYGSFLYSKDDRYATRKKTYDFGRILFLIAILNVILAITMLIINYFIDADVNKAQVEKKNFFVALMDKVKPDKRENINFSFFKKRKNILLVGVDKSENPKYPFLGTRTDTILLVTLDPARNNVSVISVPRDSKVYLSGDRGVQKINSAHVLGGIDLTKSTLEETLGIKIDNYIAINNEGVRKVVDALGGIPVYIEKNMYYNDNSQGLHVNLQKGLHVLDGEQAEGYIRYRHDALGDIGRTSRQQWFLKGLLEKVQSPSSIAKIPEVIQVVMTYTKTDLSVYELTQLATFMKGIDLSSVEVATLPGAPSKKGYVSYWILDPEKTQEVINRLVYKETTKSDEKQLVAGIMYAPSQEEIAMEIKNKLESYGYEVNCTGRANLPHSQVLTHNTSVSSEFISWLRKKIPEVKNSQFVYDPVRMYCVKSDFTIVIAED